MKIAFHRRVHLDVRFSHAELHQLLTDITPFRFHLENSTLEWLEFEAPSTTELVTDYGLRVTAKGRVRVTPANVPMILEVRSTTVVFEPVVIGGGVRQRLAFAVHVERLDFEKVPTFVETRIEEKLTKMLAPNETALVFDFAEMLTRQIGVTPKILPLQELALEARGGRVEVTEKVVKLSVEMGARIVPATESPAPFTKAEKAKDAAAIKAAADGRTQSETVAVDGEGGKDVSEEKAGRPIVGAATIAGDPAFAVIHEI